MDITTIVFHDDRYQAAVLEMNPELTEITVVGNDDTGLLAQITTFLFEHEINIEDLDQAVEDGLFRMTMHTDTSEMDCSEEQLGEIWRNSVTNSESMYRFGLHPITSSSLSPSSSRKKVTALKR